MWFEHLNLKFMSQRNKVLKALSAKEIYASNTSILMRAPLLGLAKSIHYFSFGFAQFCKEFELDSISREWLISRVKNLPNMPIIRRADFMKKAYQVSTAL